MSHHHPSLRTCNTCKEIRGRCSPYVPKPHPLVYDLPSTRGYTKQATQTIVLIKSVSFHEGNESDEAS
jgi:hypothetical protein